MAIPDKSDISHKLARHRGAELRDAEAATALARIASAGQASLDGASPTQETWATLGAQLLGLAKSRPALCERLGRAWLGSTAEDPASGELDISDPERRLGAVALLLAGCAAARVQGAAYNPGWTVASQYGAFDEDDGLGQEKAGAALLRGGAKAQGDERYAWSGLATLAAAIDAGRHIDARADAAVPELASTWGAFPSEFAPGALRSAVGKAHSLAAELAAPAPADEPTRAPGPR